MAIYSIYWNSHYNSEIGRIQYIEIYSPKYLIKDIKNNIYSIKPEFYNNGQFQPLILEGKINPNDNDFINSGFDDLMLLSQDMKVGEETFKPVDKIKLINGGKFKILMKEIE